MFEARGLTKSFGGLLAVDSLDLHVGQGEVVGLIGPNGAGKTTVFNLVTGFLKPTSGKVIFKGEDISGASPHLVARKGIVRSFQLTSVYPNLTVLQNVVAARYLNPRMGFWEALVHTPGSRKKDAEIRSRAMDTLQFLGLESYKNHLAKSLPHGYKRILGIAIALTAEPEFLLLDEPLTGMNAGEVNEAVGLISKIWDSGKTILIIEHNMRAAMSLCQRVIVMNFGKKIAEGTPQQVSENEEVIEAYLGVAARATKG